MSFRRPTLVSIASTTTTRPQQQSLAKRLLFNSQLDGVLPPILASTNAPPELTNELYDFIALSLRAYVNPWWTKLTRHDRDLLPHISRILIVVIRNIESRLLALDAAPLAFHDLPVIVTQHYRDYRNATAKLSTAYASGGAMPLSHLFHSIQPHMAISPDGALNQEYYRQIIDVILKNSLPPEDYNPEAERFIIRELILKILLVDIIPKITQPWFIYRTILDQLDPLDAQVYTVRLFILLHGHVLTSHIACSYTLLAFHSPFVLSHTRSYHPLRVTEFLNCMSRSHACVSSNSQHHQACEFIPIPNSTIRNITPRKFGLCLRKVPATASLYARYPHRLFSHNIYLFH